MQLKVAKVDHLPQKEVVALVVEMDMIVEVVVAEASQEYFQIHTLYQHQVLLVVYLHLQVLLQ